MAIITTNPANCKDCYRCVRSCPVKAIRIHRGHAEVVAERCILDGECVRVCPQHAKVVKTDLAQVRAWLDRGEEVVASLAPSFVSVLDATFGQMTEALHRLGFVAVEETALAAKSVAEEHRRILAHADRPVIGSSCPTIVNLVERYYPHLVPLLAPVVSPMIAHAMALRSRLGDQVRVVFIGPCLAKIAEREREGIAQWVDAVITFNDLFVLLKDQSINPPNLIGANTPAMEIGAARLFPLGGGMLKAASLSSDLVAEQTLSATGLAECMAVLDQLDTSSPSAPVLIELLACPGGCINGPGHTGASSTLQRRQRVLAYAGVKGDESPKVPRPANPGEESGQLSCSFTPKPIGAIEPNEEQIHEILASIGKIGPEDELNCGACGYSSCRAKAIAVFHGMAEREMCMPYMRQQAESMANLIIQASPDGVVVVDRQLRIVEINPSFASMFACQRERVAGRLIGEFMDPEPFLQTFATQESMHLDLTVPSYGLIFRGTLFYVAHQGVVIALLDNMTQEVMQQRELDQVRSETLEKAQEVINKQMRVAQEIAGLLGETTAETKVLLTKLMRVMRGEGGA
ncbi:MAG: [Fe-Fe] hydrogenase large subunit C-terminal domain-containing protein [Bacillota bacterium]